MITNISREERRKLWKGEDWKGGRKSIEGKLDTNYLEAIFQEQVFFIQAIDYYYKRCGNTESNAKAHLRGLRLALPSQGQIMPAALQVCACVCVFLARSLGRRQTHMRTDQDRR